MTRHEITDQEIARALLQLDPCYQVRDEDVVQL